MKKWGNNANIKYVPKVERGPITNASAKYTTSLFKSERERLEIIPEVETKLKNGCIYLPNYFCETNDLTLFNQLKTEILAKNGLINWSKHYKHENPDGSSTFNQIVQKLAEHFNVDVHQTRFNYYKDGNDWKPFHHDSHAYGGVTENFTMGVSFGTSRQLDFLHKVADDSCLAGGRHGVVQEKKFSFPQNNGDIFAFDSDVNKLFMHGVPKAPEVTGDRISIIAWGKRR